jgi:hypothetical protein
MKIASQEETIGCENILNNRISANKISIQELNQALMYRTSELDNYFTEKIP